MNNDEIDNSKVVTDSQTTTLSKSQALLFVLQGFDKDFKEALLAQQKERLSAQERENL